MNKLIAIVCIWGILLSFVGCSPKKETGVFENEQQLYDALFDINNKVSVNLDMPESELLKLTTDYYKFEDHAGRSPIYRMADLTITITTPDGTQYVNKVEQVGVRTKGGDHTRFPVYTYEKGIYNLVHLKISFQETFDDPEMYGDKALSWTQAERAARKNRTFATMEKLDMKWNRSDDPTFIRGNYSSMLYREQGVLAVQGNLASFDWSGTHMGVYLLTETIDEVFLARNLPKEALGGDLYKCAYLTKFDGNDTIGVENDMKREYYAFDLKTNKKTSDHSSLNRLLAMLNDGTPTKEEIAELVDMDYWLTYVATAYFLGNGDDMRGDYNNVYIYFRADTGKAIFIPHDFDRGLGVTGGWKDAHQTMTKDSPYSKVMGWFGETQKNPLFLYTVCTGGYFIPEYNEKLWQVADSELLDNRKFEEYYNTAYSLYAEDAAPGTVFENAKGKVLQFDLKKTSPVSSKENTSFKDYLAAKMVNFYQYMDEAE